MDVELQINNSASPDARFPDVVTFAVPRPHDQPSGRHRPDRQLCGSPAPRRPAVAPSCFAAARRAPSPTASRVPVPVNGTSMPFFVAGRFGRPSAGNGDVRIEARAGNTLVGSVSVMVRIRKNANTLSTAERDRFVAAFAQLNNQGLGPIRRLPRHAHQRELAAGARRGGLSALASRLSPGPRARASGDRPERRPALLALRPCGARTSSSSTSSGCPIRWARSGSATATRCSSGGPTACRASTAGRSSTPVRRRRVCCRRYRRWRSAPSIAPSGPWRATRTALAHTSFGGSISSIGSAARDPLFFLLHCNVDRLWAKWQRQNGRFNAAQAASYDPGSHPIGHNLPDTMWPWNGVTGNPRPPTAPGGALAASPTASAPGPQPTVRSTLDYQGAVGATARMGFDYDDVPF